MKKIIFVTLLTLFFTACLTRVDLENKGDLAISIAWPESTATNTISKTIKSGTASIKIQLSKENETTITEIINHSYGETHTYEHKNMTVGDWTLVVSCFDGANGSGSSTGQITKTVTISANSPTRISTNFGSPIKNLTPYSTSIQDGAQTNGGSLIIENLGNSYNESTLDSSVKFYLSDNMNFTSNVKTYDVGTMTNSQTTVAATVGYNFSAFTVVPNKTYYWKVILTNTYGSAESNIFKFTTIP